MAANGSAMKKFQRQLMASVMKPPISGPPTVPSAMTAPKRPMYLPRSRGEMMSAMTIWVSAVRPPAPRPWKTRMVMSMLVSCENPAMAEAITKISSESCSSSLRLDRSASLPQIGVEMVVASRVAVTTQVYEVWSPAKSEMITGSEVDTTVPARIETNMPMSRPVSDCITWRWVMPESDSAGAALVVGVWDKRGSKKQGIRWLIDINYMKIVVKIQPISL